MKPDAQPLLTSGWPEVIALATLLMPEFEESCCAFLCLFAVFACKAHCTLIFVLLQVDKDTHKEKWNIGAWRPLLLGCCNAESESHRG